MQSNTLWIRNPLKFVLDEMQKERKWRVIGRRGWCGMCCVPRETTNMPCKQLQKKENMANQRIGGMSVQLGLAL